MQTFAEFWPFYLREHSRPLTRTLHFTGTSLALLTAAGALISGRPLWLLGAPVSGYAFAWIGHFFVEHNRPATFRHPLWSFAGDFKMLWCALSGRLPDELARAGVSLEPART
jgi:hypothetical protein